MTVPKCKECNSLRISKASIFADDIKIILHDRDIPYCKKTDGLISPKELEDSPQWCPLLKAGDPHAKTV